MAKLLGKNYTKNASYYYIGHFSKFIQKDAQRIAFSKFTDKLEVTAFQNPDNSIVVIVLNKTDINGSFSVALNGKVHNEPIAKHSIVTLIIDSN